jgi:predicted nucleotidyltransferase component of viral defense system
VITKELLLAIAADLKLLPTTVNKDYALGWLLAGIGQHPLLGKWVFKGGTCLKKAYFDTYRFSEDLDFTVPTGEPYDEETILRAVREAAAATYEISGIEFLPGEIRVASSVNKRQQRTFDIKVPFQGPLRQNNKSIQRITFDVTQDEVLVAPPEARAIFHGYADALEPPARVLCYSVNEIIAEKTRALYERQGRARDVYDVVNISRNFRHEIDSRAAKDILLKKFKFKDLPTPTTDVILSRIDADLLRQNWDQQLRHQLPALPPVDSFLDDLGNALRWWIDGIAVPEPLRPVSQQANEVVLPRERFAARYSTRARTPSMQGSAMNQLRFAARSHLCVALTYSGVTRIVEPYSLRTRGTGTLLLYAFEVRRGSGPGGGIKAFKVAEIQGVDVTTVPFQPRYAVEL